MKLLPRRGEGQRASDERRTSVEGTANGRSVAVAVASTRDATLERLFDLLGLHPRVPPSLLADVVIAFEDGLVLASVVQPEQDPRVPFDVFWLAVLGMAE